MRKISFIPAAFSVITSLIVNSVKGADDKLAELGQPCPTVLQEIEQPDTVSFARLSINSENDESKVRDLENKETSYTQINQPATDYISTLPTELRHHIFNYIPLNIPCQKQTVSKLLNDMINEYISAKKISFNRQFLFLAEIQEDKL